MSRFQPKDLLPDPSLEEAYGRPAARIIPQRMRYCVLLEVNGGIWYYLERGWAYTRSAARAMAEDVAEEHYLYTSALEANVAIVDHQTGDVEWVSMP